MRNLYYIAKCQPYTEWRCQYEKKHKETITSKDRTGKKSDENNFIRIQNCE